MPLRLNWFPWIETKIWWFIRSWTARLQDISLFLLSWRLNCHFLPEVECTTPSVLFLFSADSARASAKLLLARFDFEVVEIRKVFWTPFCWLASAIAGCSRKQRSDQYWVLLMNKPAQLVCLLTHIFLFLKRYILIPTALPTFTSIQRNSVFFPVVGFH